MPRERIVDYHWYFPIPIGPDGQPVTSVLRHYKNTKPRPTERVPWVSKAPVPRSQINTEESRLLDLAYNKLSIYDVRSNYEIRWLNDHGKTHMEIWPEKSFDRVLAEHPYPDPNPQWKTHRYFKQEAEEFILDESNPLMSRVYALYFRTCMTYCKHTYSRYDLIEKGLEMVHELKFHVQGDSDWGTIHFLEAGFKECYFMGKTKDEIDPRSCWFECHMTTAQFIIDQCVGQMHEVGYDLDRKFALLFGLESSPRVKRGESPILWEGYNHDPDGEVDWGLYRVAKRQKLTNGVVNGHLAHSEENSEVEEEDEHRESEDPGEETEELYEDGDIDAEDDDESDLEEVSADTWREASLAREASQARESSVARDSSSDIEITASHVIQRRGTTPDGYPGNSENSVVSEGEAYSEEDDGMDYDERGEYTEEGDYDEEDDYDGEADNDDDTMRPMVPGTNSRTESEFRGFTDEEEHDTGRDDGDTREGSEGTDRDGDSPMQEPIDDISVADSDELQILEEHHLEQPTFEDEQWQEPTVYAIRAAETVGVDPEQADEVFDEQGRAYDEDLAYMGHQNESEHSQDSMLFVPDSVVDTDHGPTAEDKINEDERPVSDTIYESYVAQEPNADSRSPSSDATSAAAAEPTQEMVEIDPALTKDHGFADLARRAIQRAGADQDSKSAETSGLSSPPSSQQSEGSEAGQVDGAIVSESAEETQESYTMQAGSSFGEIVQDTPQIDPALLGLSKAVEVASEVERPVTAGGSSQKITGTPRGRTSRPVSQDITPFRKEHPRVATGVIIIPLEDDGDKEGVKDAPPKASQTQKE